MNAGGRIAVCGAISQYNNDPTKPNLGESFGGHYNRKEISRNFYKCFSAFMLRKTVPFDYFSLVYKNIKMEGFMVQRWEKEWLEGIYQLRDWIIEVSLLIR